MLPGREGTLSKPLFCLLLLTAGAAQAAGPTTVMVGSGDCRDPELLAHSRALTDALKAKLGPRLMDEDAVRERLRPESSRSLDDLKRQLDAAQMQFYQADFGGAEAATNAALRDVNRLPAGADRFKLWTKAQLLLALLYRDTGRPESSDEAFRKVLRLSPEYQLDADFFSPNTRTRFEKLRKDVATGKKVKLEVRSSPAGADVFLEGVKQGKTPFVGELPPGSYALSVVKDEAVSFPRLLNLGGNMQVHVDLAFEGAVQPTRVPCIADRGDETMRLLNAVKLATMLDADEVVILRLERQRIGPAWLAATLVNVQSAQKIREGGLKLQQPDKPAEGLSELATFVVTGQRNAVVETPPPFVATPLRESPVTANENAANVVSNQSQAMTVQPPPAEVRSEAGSGSWKKTAAIAAAGIGVLGVGTGVVFQLQTAASQREMDSYRLPGGSFDPDKKFQIAEARDRASNQQAIAFVGFGVGAVALGSAAYFWFTKPAENAVAIAPAVGPGSIGVVGSF